ncbi:MAG TPA: DUF4864 domain-containing protein [Devosiaceae bacterium]|jgi:hypothetical protein
MRLLSGSYRVGIAVVFLSLSALLGVSRGQEASDKPWQAVVRAQIEAFRSGDGATALSLAGAGFQEQFTDPDQFVAVIAGSGYGPLMQSVGMSFGEFQQLDDKNVIQIVKLIGPDQHVYQAVYQMMEEAAGWRVESVAMSMQEGLGV